MLYIMIEYVRDVYFISLFYDGNRYSADSNIAHVMGVSKKYYQNLLMNKFAGKIIIEYDDMYIKDEDDANEIAKWLEENIMPYILLKELNPNIVMGVN